MTDEELMMGYQKGDEGAFMLLYEKYSPMVYGYIKKRLRTSEREDFYQKVWRQLHEKRHLYRDQPFAPWFFVMMKHLLIDEYRSLGKKKELFLLPVEETPDDLDEMLKDLPSETRELVEKYYLEGFSYEELEKETGLTQSNLRQKLSRALRGLRTKYER